MSVYFWEFLNGFNYTTIRMADSQPLHRTEKPPRKSRSQSCTGYGCCKLLVIIYALIFLVSTTKSYLQYLNVVQGNVSLETRLQKTVENPEQIKEDVPVDLPTLLVGGGLLWFTLPNIRPLTQY